MNLKGLSLLLITPLLLTGCFGGSESTESSIENDGTMQLYSSADFSINFPQDWEIKEQEDFPSNVPSGTIVSFQNKIKSERFTANLNVSLSKLPEEVNSKDLALNSIAKAKNSLLSFTEINREEFQLQVSEELTLETFKITFSGKKTSIEDIIEFKQIYFSHNNIGYVVTGAYLPDEDENVVNLVDVMLDSFALN